MMTAMSADSYVCVCVRLVSQVGVGVTGRPGDRLLPLHAQDRPTAYIQGALIPSWFTLIRLTGDVWFLGSRELTLFSLPLQACTLLLSFLFVYDVFFVFVTPLFTKVCPWLVLSDLTTVCVTASVIRALLSTEWGKYNGGSSGWSLWFIHTWKGELVFKFHASDTWCLNTGSPQALTSSRRVTDSCSDALVFLQLPMVLKVPRLNFSPLALCDRPFSLLGFGDVLVPGNETHQHQTLDLLKSHRSLLDTIDCTKYCLMAEWWNVALCRQVCWWPIVTGLTFWHSPPGSTLWPVQLVRTGLCSLNSVHTFPVIHTVCMYKEPQQMHRVRNI